MVNPSRVSLTCKNGHSYIYELSEHGEVDCKQNKCSLSINSSRVTRGAHPYIVVTSNEYIDGTKRIPTLAAVPLSSQTTFSGLPDVYPINKTVQNSLTFKSYALVHQIRVIDAGCFKDKHNNWIERIGQLSKQDKEGIESRLKYFLGLGLEPDDDWIRRNATLELAQKIYGQLIKEEREILLEAFINADG